MAVEAKGKPAAEFAFRPLLLSPPKPADDTKGDPLSHIAKTALESPENLGGFFAFAFSPDGRTLARGAEVLKATAAGDTAEIKFGGAVLLLTEFDYHW